MNRYHFRIIVVGVILLAGALGYRIFTAGLRVTVRNTGREVMGSVTIRLNGQTYQLGDLVPGGSQTQRVSPTSASQVAVEFKGKEGSMVRVRAGGILEPSYRGQIDIEIKDGQVVGVKSDVGPDHF